MRNNDYLLYLVIKETGMILVVTNNNIVYVTIIEIFGKILNRPVDHLRQQNEIPSSAAASRPKDSHLSNDRLKQIGIDTTHIPFEQWWSTYLSSA